MRKPDIVRIASAFFSLSGYSLIANKLSKIKQVRIMLGAGMPDTNNKKPIDATFEFHRQSLLNKGLRKCEEQLKLERDSMPFSRGTHGSIKKLVNALSSKNFEVRRYEKEFMHAKAYIVSSENNNSDANGIIVGSSNLTKAGLTDNCELNLGKYSNEVVNIGKLWFDELWEEAEPYDLAQIYKDMLEYRTPWEIYIRVLWQLYGEEVLEDNKLDSGLPLTNFQKHGVIRALRLINEHGGALVADEVGLGKTFIAGEILSNYVKQRQRALILCPAALRDSTWKQFISEHQLFVECLSYEELARDAQLQNTITEPKNASKHLRRDLSEYQLVIIDEAHNYRNAYVRTRSQTLKKLLYGKKRDLLLLTATPVNNSLWDLYNLLTYFLRQDGKLSSNGILSIRECFKNAVKKDPSNLHPDDLYPIIDATTLKRTRYFIQQHYENEKIKLPDGTCETIVFPDPVAESIKYKMDETYKGYFERLKGALGYNSKSPKLTFSRYTPEDSLINKYDIDEEETHNKNNFVNLLRVSILKRFESSAFAFSKTISRMCRDHKVFLQLLDKGIVATTQYLREVSINDDEIVDEELEILEIVNNDSVNDIDYQREGGIRNKPRTKPASLYDVKTLRKKVERDLHILNGLLFDEDGDKGGKQKLAVLEKAITDIVKKAHKDALPNEKDEQNKRKIIIFSQFADTVEWIREHLDEQFKGDTKDSELNIYKGKVESITGKDHSNWKVVNFAPDSMGSNISESTIDILISTDVLAEGVNLQQCRNIINFDLPWNPMKLVQRHGRIDRIGSSHKRVYLKTFFPIEQLEELLKLHEIIHTKLQIANASIGVPGPIEGIENGRQVFTESREEIEKLLSEDSSIFKRGGTIAAAQTGEEYRQTLRKVLEEDGDYITKLPYKVGSGMKRGEKRGVIFCAVVGKDSEYERTFLRFVEAGKDWRLIKNNGIVDQPGTCLRMLACERETDTCLPRSLYRRIFDYWEKAKDHIYDSWMLETDPANLQPKVPKFNHQVAEFIRDNIPIDVNDEKIYASLDILESPWPTREVRNLKEWFNDESYNGKGKSKMLVNNILDTGLEPAIAPQPLPLIDKDDDIELVCWLAIEKEEPKQEKYKSEVS